MRPVYSGSRGDSCPSRSRLYRLVFAKSKRQVSLEQAHELARLVTGKTRIVGVFVSPSLEDLEQAIAQVPLDIVQIHGTFDEDQIPKITVPVIRAIQLRDGEAQVLSQADYLLFDAPVAGSGQTFDWDLLKDQKIRQDFFIAGGLTVNNARQARETFRPYAWMSHQGSKQTDAKI